MGGWGGGGQWPILRFCESLCLVGHLMVQWVVCSILGPAVQCNPLLESLGCLLKVLHISLVAHTVGAYPGFLSTK